MTKNFFNENNLIWIDLEMTGLNPKKDRIIEIAILVTDNNLNVLIEGPVLQIHQSESKLLLMDDWNKKVHNTNGLLREVKNSFLDELTASKIILDFLKTYVPYKTSPICGSSVAQDRRFLFEYMPELESYFHYRYLDVSTVKELVLRWRPSLLSKFNFLKVHRAKPDIYESVRELIFYRENFIK